MAGMIDFISGAAGAGAQIGMEHIRAQIEAEKEARLAQFQEARDVRLNQQVVDRETTATGVRREDVATKRSTDLEDAPILAGVKSQADIDTERAKRGMPAAALTPEDAALKRSQGGYYDANTRRADADTRAINEDRKYRRADSGASTRADTAALNRGAALAASSVRKDLSGEKDDTGRPVYDGQTLSRFEALASALVRSGGHDPQAAASIAAGAPIMKQSDLAARLASEEKELSRVGTIRGALTAGIEGGDVEVGGKTMKIEQWRTERAKQIRQENDREVAAWAAEKGVSEPGRPGAASGGRDGGYPEGTILEKDGKRYEVRGGKPVPVGGEGGGTASAPGAFDQSGSEGTGMISQPASAPARTAAATEDVEPPQFAGSGRSRRETPEWRAWKDRQDERDSSGRIARMRRNAESLRSDRRGTI